MPLGWSDEIDEILAGDLAAALAYATPAGGVVVMPMAPLGLRDRERGTVTVTSSLGLWKKLERIRRNPSVALAYHAREHSDTDLRHFVLVQGRATVAERPDRAWLESITPQAEHFLGPRERGLRGRLLRVYYWERVPVTIAVERIVAWPNQLCEGEPEVLGAALPGPAPPQSEPKNGTAPRVDAGKLARYAERLPHTLLGWIGADGLPEVAPVRVGELGSRGAELAGAVELPPGGRRAGLTSHAFQPRMIGQEQRIHTGWLEVGTGGATYAPHSRTGYALPPSKLLFTLGCTVATRSGLRKARKRASSESRR